MDATASFVADAPTLAAIISTSAQLHAVGTEEAVRSMDWKSPEIIRRRIAY
jgi:hypothetical protein